MKGTVVCPQPIASEVGVSILERGGNAVDAAVAAAFVQCVVDPLNASIGGFGVAQVRPAGSAQAQVVAFHGRAPLAARPDMFAPIAAGSSAPLASGTYLVERHANQIGYLAPTVPGTVKGLVELLGRFGRMDLPAVLAPAIELSRTGWAVTWEHWSDWTREVPADRLDASARFRATPEAARIYTRAGELWPVGSRIINADYADTLELIAAEGPDVFYSGEIARAIHGDFQLHGGLITYGDLAQYEIETTTTLETTYRGYRVTSSPPPAGGLVVMEILNLLEPFDLPSLLHNGPAYVHVIAEAMRIAFEDMRLFLGDPKYVDVPISALLDKGHAATRASHIRFPGPHGRVNLAAHVGETTQVVAGDEEGTYVSITHSLGAASGVVTRGLGFIFNGQMHRFDPVPGRANSIAPGKRRVTGMAPTIIWKQDQPWAVLGGVGGNSIIGGVVQTVLNLIDFKMDVMSAIASPRFHCEGGEISLEGRFPRTCAAALKQLGHSVALIPRSYDRTLAGAVYAVSIPGGGSLHGAADPRQGGVSME